MRSIENTGIDLTEIGVADETTIEFIRKHDLLRIDGYNVGAARNLLRKIGFENLPYNFSTSLLPRPNQEFRAPKRRQKKGKEIPSCKIEEGNESVGDSSYKVIQTYIDALYYGILECEDGWSSEVKF